MDDLEDIDLSGVTSINNFTELQAVMKQDTLTATDVLITDGTGTIRLRNIRLSDLQQEDFIFV